jgi:hypothetical protein
MGGYAGVKGPGIVRYNPLLESLGPLVYVGSSLKEYSYTGLLTRDSFPISVRLQALIGYDPRAAPEMAPILTRFSQELLFGIVETYLRWALENAIAKHYASELVLHEVVAQIAEDVQQTVTVEMSFLGLQLRRELRIVQLELPSSLSERQEIIAQRRASALAEAERLPDEYRRALITEFVENLTQLSTSDTFLDFNELLEAYAADRLRHKPSPIVPPEKAAEHEAAPSRRSRGFPIDNPYVVGNPVYPPLFVGRRAVFDRIGQIWSAKSQPDSIILYGHRRMGKSSILRNLDQVAPLGGLIVYADMAGATAFVESTTDLLLGLADRVLTAVRRVYPEIEAAKPDHETYNTPSKARLYLDHLIEQARHILAGRPLILALDEFEAIEGAVLAGKVSRDIFQFLRAKSQEPSITLVLGGLHTLDEMSRDYQQPFYGSYENIRVSYLTRDDAWRLIVNPTLHFRLNYEPEAVEYIIAETGGQPYLVQLICRDALDHLNHELFDENKERDVLITLSDVEAVLGPDFFRRGTVYFDGVWTQAGDPAQRSLLRTMAQRDAPWLFNELADVAGLDVDSLRQHLRWAERHDILREIGSNPPTWQFWVPLMRRWIRESA